MQCALHAGTVVLSSRCHLCSNFERELLTMGPRTASEYDRLALKYELTSASAVPFVRKTPDGGAEHVVFSVAKAVASSRARPVVIKSLFAEARHAKWFADNINSQHLKEHVQLVPGGRVKSRPKLGAYDKQSLIAAVKRQGIRGWPAGRLRASTRKRSRTLRQSSKPGW